MPPVQRKRSSNPTFAEVARPAKMSTGFDDRLTPNG
jgi:hypothetical protein